MESNNIMNTNFEYDFLKSMTKYKIKDKYYDEYLKTTRYHLLSYNNLCDQYKNYTNNNIINDNKHTFIHINENKKDFILNKIKSLIIKQKKLYNNLIHHYKTTNPEFLNEIETSRNTQDNASVRSVKTIKSIDSSHSSKSTQSKHSIRSKHSIQSIQSKQSTKSTKIYRIERKKEHDTLSLNEPKKQKFTFFTRKNKDNN